MNEYFVKNEAPHNQVVEHYNEYAKRSNVKSPKDADVIFCGGGDGTLLKTINEYRQYGKPFFGCAAGTANFLMNKDWKIKDNHKIKTFDLIEVEVTYAYENEDAWKPEDYWVVTTKTFQAFNDVMCGGDMNSWIEFDIQEKDQLFGKFKGGGVIISTPQGSTGINKSNLGTVLPLSSNLWSITGDKTERRIDYVIKPRKMTIGFDSRRPVTVWIDGANHVIENVESVTLRKGEKVKVIFNDYDEFMRKRRT